MALARLRTACSAASHYAIVDEVDSILIDEARTPLIISGPADESHRAVPRRSTRIVPQLTRQKEEEGEGDYWVDEKAQAGAPVRSRAWSTPRSCCASTAC